MSLLNPFSHIVGPKYAPHAPTLRSSFWRKVKDCFHVFYGSSGRMGPKYQIGVLDYLMLGLPLLCMKGVFGIKDTQADSFLKKVGLGLAGLIVYAVTLVVYLAKLLIASCMTLFAALFIIPITHLVSTLVAGKDKERVLSLPCETFSLHASMSVREALKRHQVDFSDIQINTENNPCEIILPPTAQRHQNGLFIQLPVQNEKRVEVEQSFYTLGLTPVGG